MRDALAAAGLAELGDAERASDADTGSVVVGVVAVGAEQITAGLVVLDLDPTILLEDRRVTYRGRPALRSGPFVCVWAEADGETTWTGLTRKERDERLPIEPAWRLGGGESWQMRRQFLTDGANLWHGPRDAFANAAWRETFSDPDELPRLSAEGLAAVRAKCEQERWRRLPLLRGLNGVEAD